MSSHAPALTGNLNETSACQHVSLSARALQGACQHFQLLQEALADLLKAKPEGRSVLKGGAAAVLTSGGEAAAC
jgi:hypothetical protein